MITSLKGALREGRGDAVAAVHRQIQTAVGEKKQQQQAAEKEKILDSHTIDTFKVSELYIKRSHLSFIRYLT